MTSGFCWIKWNVPSSTSVEHRGRTERSPVKDHKVLFDYHRTLSLKLVIDKSNSLVPCYINFEIVQDYSATVKAKKEVSTLGNVKLNLAEYVEESEGVEGEEGVVRRYLMMDSKINSTLKVAIRMIQVDGERNFVAPPLKSAAVFGGIAGIMAGEQAETDDPGREFNPISSFASCILKLWKPNADKSHRYTNNQQIKRSW